jgi:hypothetical protein
MRTNVIATALAFAATLVAAPAYADPSGLAGELGVATGVEGGDDGTGATAFRRARTRIVAGAELRRDGDRGNGLLLRGFAEIEPRTGFGGEVRYARWFHPRFAGMVGVTGTFAPHVLVGPVAAVQLHIPMDAISIFVEPSLSVLPFGTDLPTDRPLIWGLLTFGVRLDVPAREAREE